jgi:hypothetical protein
MSVHLDNFPIIIIISDSLGHVNRIIIYSRESRFIAILPFEKKFF